MRSAAVLEADVCAGEVVGLVSRLGGELAVPDEGGEIFGGTGVVVDLEGGSGFVGGRVRHADG